MTNGELKALVDQYASQLREHVDSVQIFVTYDSDDGQSDTVAYESGRGNFYARQGQIEEWLTVQKQYQMNWAVRKDAKLNP